MAATTPETPATWTVGKPHRPPGCPPRPCGCTKPKGCSPRPNAPRPATAPTPATTSPCCGSLDFRSFRWSRRRCGPGPEDGLDFGVGGLSWVCWRKTSCDQGPPELDHHVFEGRLGLFLVPRLLLAAGVDVSRVISVHGIPAHDQRVH